MYLAHTSPVVTSHPVSKTTSLQSLTALFWRPNGKHLLCEELKRLSGVVFMAFKVPRYACHSTEQKRRLFDFWSFMDHTSSILSDLVYDPENRHLFPFPWQLPRFSLLFEVIKSKRKGLYSPVQFWCVCSLVQYLHLGRREQYISIILLR